MSAFLKATAIAKKDGRYTAVIDPDWFIWGPFGGYLAALAMRAMGRHSTHRRPATFSCQYLNVGAAGPVDIEVQTRKSGRRAECLLAVLEQDGKTLVEAQSWIVAEELTGLNHDNARMPDIEPVCNLPHWNGFDNDESHSPPWNAAAGLLGAQSTLWSAAGKLLAAGTAQNLCVPNPRHPASGQVERVDEAARASNE